MEATAATGIEAYGLRAKNFAASFLFISGAFLAYRYSPHSAELMRVRPSAFALYSGADVLTASCVAYSVLLALFYLLERSPRVSKSILALRALGSLARSPRLLFRGGLPREERLGLLTILLKSFFAPLMVVSLFDFTGTMIANGNVIFTHASALRTDFLAIFNSHGFWFLFQLILFLDVLFFTVGYLVEHPALGNEIRSVDPTWLGWAVALACYPPFNGLVTKVLGWRSTDFPQFERPGVHLAVSALLLLLMAIYASASVALNLKASNLTHRGIIGRGPYRWVRHPAYLCKNLAWWLGIGPAIVAAWQHNAVAEALLAAGSAASWTAVYVLRALTEEDHLRSVDGEYDAYCRKVRYRFIPGVY